MTGRDAPAWRRFAPCPAQPPAQAGSRSRCVPACPPAAPPAGPLRRGSGASHPSDRSGSPCRAPRPGAPVPARPGCRPPTPTSPAPPPRRRAVRPAPRSLRPTASSPRRAPRGSSASATAPTPTGLPRLRPRTRSFSYPHRPLVTPGGNAPKSIRRPSPDSDSPSGIARRLKPALPLPTANVTLAGMAVWSAPVAPPRYVTASGIVTGRSGLAFHTLPHGSVPRYTLIHLPTLLSRAWTRKVGVRAEVHDKRRLCCRRPASPPPPPGGPRARPPAAAPNPILMLSPPSASVVVGRGHGERHLRLVRPRTSRSPECRSSPSATRRPAASPQAAPSPGARAPYPVPRAPPRPNRLPWPCRSPPRTTPPPARPRRCPQAPPSPCSARCR